MTIGEAVAQITDGMTVGIGGGGLRGPGRARGGAAPPRGGAPRPYDDAEDLVPRPALPLDVALVPLNRADRGGNAQSLGPDPYFDDLFCRAATRRLVSCERIVPTAELVAGGPLQSLLLNRAMVDGVVETPRGAHFTSCVPDYGRDEAFQRRYAKSAAPDESWAEFRERMLPRDESSA